MSLKPWYKIVTPREDLREGASLDASSFAVHLDQVVRKSAPDAYLDPAEFFSRTYMTGGLREVASEVMRSLAGEMSGTSQIVNLSTQFGGGKTHALTLLYHLATSGSEADQYRGVDKLLANAGLKTVPHAAVATFVGTEFDALSGVSGDGPTRRTPWGDIAWQIGGETSFKEIAGHDEALTAPAGSVIRKILPRDKPVLILMDEVMNYMNQARARGTGESNLASQFLQFVQNLTSVASDHSERLTLVLSLPASELEMTAEDESDFKRLEKLSDRVDNPYVLSEGLEITEIIRRRLFENFGDRADRGKVIRAYIDWVRAHRSQIPSWFPVDHAEEQFSASYPFHPCTISVFERKWQTLPRFQRTRGVLRMLAQLVSHVYRQGFKKAAKEPLITVGNLPLADNVFRQTMLGQLGEDRLEGAISADIAGPKAHAYRLDQEAVPTIKKARLHQQVATTLLVESTGGQSPQKEMATIPELKLALGGPEVDLGNLETVVDGLAETCYYLTAEHKKYRFSLVPNLNKLYGDSRAAIAGKAVDARVWEEVQSVFKKNPGADRVAFFNEQGKVEDRPSLTFVIVPPQFTWEGSDRKATETLLKEHLSNCGSSARQYKSALIWVVPDSAGDLRERARKLLAWESVKQEEKAHQLDDAQRRQLKDTLKRAQSELTEGVWLNYSNLVFLNKSQELHTMSTGRPHSSAAKSIVAYMIKRLKEVGEITEAVGANFLVRNWPPARPEWPTKSLRDAFFASPRFPKLLDSDAIKQAIMNGVADGVLAYADYTDGEVSNIRFKEAMREADVAIGDDVVILRAKDVEAFKQKIEAGDEGQDDGPGGGDGSGTTGGGGETGPGEVTQQGDESDEGPGLFPDKQAGVSWAGEVPPLKWRDFYKVIMPFVRDESFTLRLNFRVEPTGGVSRSQVKEIKRELQNLGISAENVAAGDLESRCPRCQSEFEAVETEVEGKKEFRCERCRVS